MIGRAGPRLLPVLIVALAALAAFKGAALLLVDEVTLSPITAATAQSANDAAAAPAAPADGAAAPASASAPTEPPVLEPQVLGDASDVGSGVEALSESERAVIESLRKRREELDARDQGLALRENLLAAAEQRIDGKIKELKAMESRIQASIKAKEDADDQQFAGLVAMYESMKPKAAARIFNAMALNVVVGVARRMQPEALGKVLALMDPTSAERVTVEIAQISAVGTGFTNELEAVAQQ